MACFHVPGVFCDNCQSLTIPRYPPLPKPENTVDWNSVLKVADGERRRERMATHALNGLLASNYAEHFADPNVYRQAAINALRFADALIAELDKEEK